ncbi:MAG: hypothetical protein MUO63_15215 [Desulfobulbaceae bacterium]|nr:hypothetical protein [Desulfobulbaceae bacterium]
MDTIPPLITGYDEKVMLVKCAACKRKLWRYDKIGQGEVLRCHKDRIKKMYGSKNDGNKI